MNSEGFPSLARQDEMLRAAIEQMRLSLSPEISIRIQLTLSHTEVSGLTRTSEASGNQCEELADLSRPREEGLLGAYVVFTVPEELEGSNK